MRVKYLKIIFFLIVFIAVVHFLSVSFYLYWQFWWLDIVMHLIAGFWVTSFILWSLFFLGVWKDPLQKSAIYLYSSIIFTILIALGWEIFEVKISLTFVKGSFYLIDAFSDVLTTAIGSFLASWWLKKAFSKAFLAESGEVPHLNEVSS